MDSNSKDKTMEEIFNSLLEIFDKHELSPEDGAFLSANLLFSSLNYLGSEDMEDLYNSLERVMSASSVAQASFRPRNHPYFIIGLNRSWGLDPSLLDEEN